MQQLTGKSWKTNYGAVLIAETFAMIGFSCSMPVIPLFLGGEIGIKNEEELKLWNGAIQSCSAVALAVFAPIWGKLADNYSRRAMLMRAMFAGSIFVSLISFARRPWQILVLRTIQGSLTGTISAATVLTVGIVPVSSLAIALGMLQTGIAAGNTIGPLIGGVITDFLGHRAAFLATGIFLFSAGLIVTFGVHEDKTIISTQAKTKKEKRKIFPDFRILFSSPIIFSLIIVSFTIQVANTTVNPIMPLFLRKIVAGTFYENFLGSATGIVLGAGALSTAIASIISGKISPRIGYWKTLTCCLALGCVSLIPQAFTTKLWQLVVIHCFASFFIGGAVPLIQAMLATNCDRGHQGSLFGLNTSISSGGAALGPLIGSTAALISYRAVFPVTALILGISSIGIFRRQVRKTSVLK